MVEEKQTCQILTFPTRKPPNLVLASLTQEQIKFLCHTINLYGKKPHAEANIHTIVFFKIGFIRDALRVLANRHEGAKKFGDVVLEQDGLRIYRNLPLAFREREL